MSCDYCNSPLYVGTKCKNCGGEPAPVQPVDGTQVSRVWWDGEKLMAKPIPLEDFYQPAPVQDAENKWRNAAIRVGEDLCSVGPLGYYDMTAEQWLEWALSVVTVHAPPTQPAPVQEPYAWHYKNAAGVSVWHFGPSKMFDADLEASKMWPRTHQLIPVYTENKRSISDCEELAALGWQAITCPSCGNVGARGYPRNTTPPAAQPAVPDAIHHTDLSEHPQYIEGWNDCRAEMLKGMSNA
jgi:hypothetical protein